MPKPKNTRRRAPATGAHISGGGPIVPARHLKIVEQDDTIQVQPAPSIQTVTGFVRGYDDAPGYNLISLQVDGKPLLVPCFALPGDPFHVRVRVSPQIILFLSEEQAEVVHQQVLAGLHKQAAASLWRPGMPLPEGMPR